MNGFPFTSPKKWDEKDTDDEECDKQQKLEINPYWDSDASNEEDYEDEFFPKHDNYPLSTSDRHYRNLLNGDAYNFGAHCEKHLEDEQYEKKRFTVKIAILYGKFSYRDLEWSNIVSILNQIRYSRASNIDEIFEYALAHEKSIKEHHDNKGKAKDNTIEEVQVLTAITTGQERTHKEFQKDLERGRQTIKEMKNSLQGIKITKNGESLYKWLKALDLDRRNHGAYVEAIERFGKHSP
ncbi:MAG: hypothetical protein GY822_25945, partial [Deltaproteobacteria bacterium]|nr:hypothetical protein [Deltaproteobacteria bacterium]